MYHAVNERIKAIYLESGEKSIRQYAIKIGVAPSTLNECLKGAEPRFSLLNAIMNGEPSISAEWLIRGKGEMVVTGFSEPSIIEDLKAEINQLKGENKVLREMIGLEAKKDISTEIAS